MKPVQAKRVSIVQVQLIRETASSLLYKDRKITGPEKASELVRQYLGDPDRENFVIVTLNAKNEPNLIETISTGTIDTSLVSPREVFKSAILSNACSLLCFHNHPSGHPEFSEQDARVTRRLVEAGKLLGIEVLDHIILGSDGKYISLKEKGIV